ncbi:MAG: AsnC family transcriptional regulator [Ilumatobacteraceae bacterium]|nr:AsnC family transcriptional regulator [Ilumatobacteraceae bacterium]
MALQEGDKPTWTFLTNHSHVLLCIAEDPEIRGRDIAQRVGITERSAQNIVRELIEGGYLTREKVGRRNRYTVHPDLPLRHPIERDHEVAELLRLVTVSPRAKA